MRKKSVNKKAKIFIIIMLFINITMIFSCKAVVSVEPLGYEPLETDPRLWEGKWILTDDSEEQILYISVIDKKNGVLDIRTIVNINKEEERKLHFEAKLKKGEKYNYINILYRDIVNESEVNKENRNTYLWFVFENKNNKIIFNYPDDNLFDLFIKNKKLNGTVSNKIIIINESSSTLTTFLENQNFELIFDKNSVIFKKIDK